MLICCMPGTMHSPVLAGPRLILVRNSHYITHRNQRQFRILYFFPQGVASWHCTFISQQKSKLCFVTVWGFFGLLKLCSLGVTAHIIGPVLHNGHSCRLARN